MAKKKGKTTKDAAYIMYITRQLKRYTWLAVAGFILFAVIMAIIWAVPKMWNWALN